MKQKKVAVAAAFIILSFSFMFADAQIHLDQRNKPSMVFTHGAHGLGESMGFLTVPELFELNFMRPNDTEERLLYTERDGVKEFRMTVDEIMWEYAKGKFVHTWAFNGRVPGPEIRVTEGDIVRVIVTNNLPVPTTVHWHGIEVGNEADGIPGFTQYPIEPGASFTYEFTATEAGTRFYHSHGNNDMDSVTQMDMGLAGAFIVEDIDAKTYDREYVYLLDEWQIAADGSNGALNGLMMGGGHAHGDHGAYNVFTVNGRIDPYIPSLIVSEGEEVLVRLINVGVQEMHPMHTHGHTFTVIAEDGNELSEEQQYHRDVVTLHPAERIDFVLQANNPGAWLFHCHHLHHAAGGMTFPLLYEGYEPCCEDV